MPIGPNGEAMPYPDDMMTGQQAQSPADLLRQGIQKIEQALQAEPDDADSQRLAQAIQTLYAVLAARQKEEDDMLQGKLSPRALRRG